jgi:hypothetical protein
MLDLARPSASPQTILEHLRTGGATDLRTATGRVWIVGHAPSGALVELYWWPGHGYSLTRRAPVDQPGQLLGVFPTWKAAVDSALQA